VETSSVCVLCGMILLASRCVLDIIYSGETMSVKKDVKMPVQGTVVDSRHYCFRRCFFYSLNLTRVVSVH